MEKAGSMRTTGLWSEAQIFNHLAGAFEYSMTAYPFVAPAVIRKTIGRLMFSSMRKKGIMPSGRPNPSAPKVREEGDAKAALKRLKGVIKTFEAHSGSTAIHPIFDHLNKEEYAHLHAMHMANHLSFIDPESSRISGEAPQIKRSGKASGASSRPAKKGHAKRKDQKARAKKKGR